MAYASSNLIKLDTDPRWIRFISRYAGDIVRFAVEVVGVQPSNQQIKFMRASAVKGSRVSVSSGHGTGKTMSLSIIVLHHLTVFSKSVCLVTANDLDQLKATFVKELNANVERIGRGKYSWLYDYIEVLTDGTTRIRGYESIWFMETKTSNNSKSANRFAGRHSKHLLLVIDEASTVDDTICSTLTGALTEENNKMILTSQQTRNSGYFWRTQNELRVDQGGEWIALVFSSFDSQWVSNEWLMSQWEEYEEDERLVRLLGKGPINSTGLMMSLQDANTMYTRGQIIQEHEPYGWLSLGDIASGEGERDKSANVHAKVIGRGDYGPDARRVEIIRVPLLTNKIRSNRFANYVAEEGAYLSNCTYVTDAGGLGVNVCQDLEDMNKLVHRVYWGSPCFQKKNQIRYLNLRAQAMHQAARAVKEGRLSVRTLDYKRTMIGQSSRIPKTFTDGYKMKVPPKHSKEWDGLSSPDLWDAVCFAFLENVHYIPASKDGSVETGSTATNVLDIADRMFAGV